MAIVDKSAAVGVEEFLAFARSLKEIDDSLPRALRQVNKDAATLVATATKSSFEGRDGVAPKVAASVRVFAQQAGAQVGIGGDAFPFALGSEFGSLRFTQFPAWRGAGATAGYSLYPTIRAKRDEVVEMHGKALDQLTARAFPD